MQPDLHTTRRALQSGRTTPQAEIEHAIAAAQSAHCMHVFLNTTFNEARAAASSPDTLDTPLAGLAVSIKDLFDVVGQTTSAGSLACRDTPAATCDSPAVARLRRAGGALMGRTNMVEFAFSGVGINPHFGTPSNAFSTDTPLIPGGSSSGAAISVATGAAFIGLGSDTGGSIRIPAALNGIVGFKNTARLVPTQGTLPLSSTLDTVCALTRSVPDAIVAHEILAHRCVIRSPAPLSTYRLGTPTQLMLNGLDATVSRAWQRTLAQLRQAGARIDELPLPELDELTHMQANAGFAAAESYVWHQQLLAQKAHLYDPRVASRIQRGATISACDYIKLQGERQRWIGRMDTAMQGFDAFLSPTVPMVAPTIATVAPGAERDEAFFRINALLLRNTSVINMLDGCAISLPCQAPDELPVGLMVWAGAMRDDLVLNIALQIEHLLQKQ
jgi:aspartyl-tRNA(Asn)/glutamyl-tRNA(Gln) amidotransferase subunit A